jgi:hypothetical protein
MARALFPAILADEAAAAVFPGSKSQNSSAMLDGRRSVAYTKDLAAMCAMRRREGV